MEIIWQISLEAIEILTLIFGILGITVSLMLLFSPKLAKTLGGILNRNVSLDNKLDYVDKGIQIETLVYNHHILMGALLVVGSVFVLFFFLSINVFSNTLSNIPYAHAFTNNNEKTQNLGEALHAIAHEGIDPNTYEETQSLLAVGLPPDFGYIELCKGRSYKDV